VRTAILAAGTLVVGLIMGVLMGLVVAGGSQEGAQRSPKTVTVTEAEYVTVTASPSPSPTATATATAEGASLLESAANKECEVGKVCDLTTGEVTITNVERTDVLDTTFETYSGDFVVVWFEYTYKGDSTADTGEAPWSLIDSEGNTYSIHFDATSGYGIEQDAPVALYEQVQPGVRESGVVVFEIAPGSEPSALIISDLVNVQGGDVAKVEL
jgi:hypothetical protein